MRSHWGPHDPWVSISTKQKLNTKSPTKCELVGVDEPLPMMLWTRLFAVAQLINVDDNILYQDKISAIQMENNGKASCTKRTSKRIDIRYFYITDKVKSGEITIEYCPTKEITADYFTKPLAGALFNKFRDVILGINDGDVPIYGAAYAKSIADRKAVELAITQKVDQPP